MEAKLENFGFEGENLYSMDDEQLLNLFCTTFDLKEPIAQNADLVKENERMREELKRLYGVERPFICGDMGDTDQHGMREFYLICPMYGADGAAIYKKYKEYSAPEY
jgi:hypothetical protein